MPYRADVYKVMIASPGDVPDERKIVRDVVAEWNDVHSQGRGQVLLPVGWETHSSPEMGEHPQGIINRQVLQGCDLLVAVFWTRLGSPTQKAASGTVEEIEAHVAAGKLAMIYFSSAPVAPDSIDPDQYAALKAFKAACRTKGLYETYDSPTDFRAKVSRHLMQKVIEKYPPREATGHDESGVRTVVVDEAMAEILGEMHDDERGLLVVSETRGGLTIEANHKTLAKVKDHKEVARYQHYVRQMLNWELIEPYGQHGEIFKITHRGIGAVEGYRKRGEGHDLSNTTGKDVAVPLSSDAVTILEAMAGAPNGSLMRSETLRSGFKTLESALE